VRLPEGVTLEYQGWRDDMPAFLARDPEIWVCNDVPDTPRGFVWCLRIEPLDFKSPYWLST